MQKCNNTNKATLVPVTALRGRNEHKSYNYINSVVDLTHWAQNKLSAMYFSHSFPSLESIAFLPALWVEISNGT